MKKVPGFVLRQMGDNLFILEQTVSINDCRKLITFNKTSAYLWQILGDSSFTEDDLVHSLLDKYEVSESQALQDVHSIVMQWKSAGIIY